MASFLISTPQSTVCFLLLMFLSAAAVYFSRRCLRHWFPSTTVFSTILWDFVATFFFEPFPSDSGILSIRLVFSFWLLGITIFCNDVNAVFKGKLAVKEYAGVETEEDLDALEYRLEREYPAEKKYYRYAHGKKNTVLFAQFPYVHNLNETIYISKKSNVEKLKTQIVWWGNIESSPLKYDPRIHEPIMNWELRLYEGSIGINIEYMEPIHRLRDAFNKHAQLFTPYEMADLSLPFQLYGYGLAAAIAAKFIETILEIYNPKPKTKSKYPKPFQ